jgi:NTE family protein
VVAAVPATARDSDERPKIGLALAGGGAKGGAHVGVLRMLEELNVPVDYIAGTSMGSIIGGLYASGLTTDELETLLTTVDWDDLMRDKPPRRDLSFRRKEDDARYLFDLEFGFEKGRVVWPTGLINGQKLFFMLQSLTLQVADVDDFDELPVPFRAVATDVNTGDAVVLDRGNVAMAMRASMAIPSVFAAVLLGDRLLVDGGLTNNVPVDVVRAMGADVVIAVDLGAPLSSRETGSFLQIYQQTMRMLTRRNMEPQLAAADLVLTPKVSVFGTLEFDAIEEIVKRGAEEAQSRAEELAAHAVAPERYAELMARHRRVDEAAPVIASVRVEGNERVDSRIIENKLRARGGEALDFDALADDLGRVYGLGDFKAVDFYIEDTAEGPGLVVRTEEKPWGPKYVRFGLSVATDLDGGGDLGLLSNLTVTQLNTRGAEWHNDLLLGTDRRITSEFYQPLDFKGRWFIAPSFELGQRRLSFFVDRREVGELSVRNSTAALDVGYQASKYAEFRLGVERGRLRVDTESGEIPADVVGDLDLGRIDLGGLVLEVQSDRLDNASVPRNGSRTRLRAFVSREGLGADAEYEKFELGASQFRSFGRDTLFGSLSAGWSSDGNLPEYESFRLGGFGSLSGFEEAQLRGQYLGVARLGIYHLFPKLLSLSDLFVGGWVEGGNVWQTRDEVGFDNLILTTTFFVGKDTAFGPVYLAFGQAEEGENKVYLAVGRTL